MATAPPSLKAIVTTSFHRASEMNYLIFMSLNSTDGHWSVFEGVETLKNYVTDLRNFENTVTIIL